MTVSTRPDGSTRPDDRGAVRPDTVHARPRARRELRARGGLPRGRGVRRDGLRRAGGPARAAAARGMQILLALLITLLLGVFAGQAATRRDSDATSAGGDGATTGGTNVPQILFQPVFSTQRRLITNEIAVFDPSEGAPVDRDWIVTSGSLFSDDGTGWTGPIDGVTPDRLSARHTDSAVFRLITRRRDFGNVTVSFDLDVAGLTTTHRTPAQAYDGVHVFLRYGGAQKLYAASVFRRDGSVAFKKKVPGGPVNGGEYTTLARTTHAVPTRRWNSVSVTITNVGAGVRMTMTIDGVTVLTATDTGSLGAPLTADGAVGIRGDNCDFHFRNFTVTG